MIGHVGQPSGQVLAGGRLGFIRRLRIEQGAEPLVDLRVDVTQPLLQTVSIERPGFRRQTGFRFEIGDVLDYGRPLGEHLAVVEFEDGHIALWAYLREVAAIGERMALEVDLDQFEIETGLVQGDMR